MTGLAADAFNIAAGATTDTLSLGCEAVTSGGCTLAAAPAAGIGNTQIAAGALMAVGHGANCLEAKIMLRRLSKGVHKMFLQINNLLANL